MNTFVDFMLRQINLFWLALSFFTRLPVPSSMTYSDSLLNQANRYFSLVGIVVGVILAILLLLFSYLFPIDIAITLMMCCSLLLTGAFHEDGLADMADGIGGAFQVDKRLAIMKDSRIGTYGAVTLLMTLLLKFMLLIELSSQGLWALICVVIMAAALSRTVAGSLISAMPYVSDSGLSKSKPLAQDQTKKELSVLIFFGVSPLFFYDTYLIVALICALIIFRQLFKVWLLRRIGGFTGDCLGAAQQLSELLIYLVIVAVFVNNSSTGSAL